MMSLGPFFAFLIIQCCIHCLRLLFCPMLIAPLIVHCCHHFGRVVVVVPCWSPPCHHLYIPASLQAVARSGGVWCCGCHRLPLVPVIVLSCVAGAGAVGIGVVVVIIVSSPFLLIIVEMVTGPLAPVPPCKQGLAVVGDGCWAAISFLSSLCAWHKSQAAPMIHPMSSFS